MKIKIKNVYLNKKFRNIVCRVKKNRLKYIEDYEILDSALEIKCINKDKKIAIVKDIDSAPYYTKYERLLKNNNIKYEFFNIHDSNWINEAKKYDCIIWRPLSVPWELEEAREKIYILEKYMNKVVYPSYDEIIFYENKTYQYDLLKLKGYPVINTFISYDYDECMTYIEGCSFPLVSKIKAGSGAEGVEIVKSKSKAKDIINKTFSIGADTYWPFIRQKNYIYFQNFIDNYGFDLRIVIVDRENIFGYFRNTVKNEFRASGYGVVEKKELPKEAVEIALKIKEDLGFSVLAVDFLQSREDNKYYIIECSNFIRIDTDSQLEIDGKPGRYIYDSINNKLVFKEGRYWIQEIVLKNIIDNMNKEE
ncbi:TPA: hypothetical protein I9Z86_001162 [Clostridium perfringens]|uniref:ATP-grasp domain-containing protein n=1 Tax=Clostridium perfringens TaxID=1502 RepID=UPI001A325CDF|nr:hypothetical protein [Clostridium perfringens]